MANTSKSLATVGATTLTTLLWFPVIVALLAVGLVAAKYYDPDPAVVRLCDEAIKGGLKAPATYKRISYSQGDVNEDTVLYVTYDAQNSFGVPLRQEAGCYMDRGGSIVEHVEPISH